MIISVRRGNDDSTLFFLRDGRRLQLSANQIAILAAVVERGTVRSRDLHAIVGVGETRGIEIEWSADGGETWRRPPNVEINLLQQECGIYLGCEEIPELIKDADDKAKFRVTATIETDFRITAVAERQDTSPLRDVVTAARCGCDWMTPAHEPSEEEIAAACEQIRAGWSESETRRRSAWAECEPVTVPVVVIEVDDSST